MKERRLLERIAAWEQGGQRTNQTQVETLDMSPTFLRLGGEGLDIGLDRKRKVSVLYAGRGVFAYPGQIRHVTVTPGPQAPGSLTNRPEALAQLD